MTRLTEGEMRIVQLDVEMSMDSPRMNLHLPPILYH